MTTDANTAASPVAAVRGCRPGDEALIRAAMLAAHGRGEYEGMERFGVEYAVERLAANPSSCLVAELDGRLAGWIIPADNALSVVPELRRRGVGRSLVDGGLGLVEASGHDHLRLWIPRRADTEAFALACAMRYTSSLWQMRLSAAAAVADPGLPSGTASRPLRWGADEVPFVDLVNRIFIDHPSPIELSVDEVRRVHAAAGFDPANVLVVEDAATGAMIGFCRVHPFTADDGRPSGEIRLLGVERAWRRRGLGRALTAWGVAELRRRGAQSVQLAVEGANEGALRLYTELGFEFGVEWPHWTLPVSPGGR